ncbi:MAG: hypothetical protein EAY65_00900 [Alphaproteobacteria bacterium]|nr:MAG: hypothetical protein EAY65_00900 [Alphaproteobacteria bacterium]
MLEVDAKRIDKSSKSSWNQLELAWISLKNGRVGRYNQHMFLFSLQFTLFLVAVTIATFGLFFSVTGSLALAMVAHAIKDAVLMSFLRWSYKACGYGADKNEIPQWNQFALAWHLLHYQRKPHAYTHHLFLGGVVILAGGIVLAVALAIVGLSLFGGIVMAVGALCMGQALDNMFMFWLVKNGTNILRAFYRHVIESYQQHVREMRTPEAEARAGLLPFTRKAEVVGAHGDDH